MEKRKFVFPIEVRLFCDEDGCPGEMRPDGRCLASNPPWYPHVCEKCGARENTRKVYPFIEYKEVRERTLAPGMR